MADEVMNGDPNQNWGEMSTKAKVDYASGMVTGAISALAGYQVAQYSRKIMAAESAMEETSMRQEARSRSKVREARLEQALSDRQFQQAMSGATSATPIGEQERLLFAEDEEAAQDTLQSAEQAERYGVWQDKMQSKRQSRASLFKSAQGGLDSLSNVME